MATSDDTAARPARASNTQPSPLSDLARVCVEQGASIQNLEDMAKIFLQTAAELRAWEDGGHA